MPENTLILLSSRRQLTSLQIWSQTKVLNTIVFNVMSSQPGNTLLPPKARKKTIVSWTMDCPKIIFHILKEIKDDPLGSGGLLSNSKVGGSVARAKAAKVSCIKFTQRS